MERGDLERSARARGIPAEVVRITRSCDLQRMLAAPPGAPPAPYGAPPAPYGAPPAPYGAPHGAPHGAPPGTPPWFHHRPTAEELAEAVKAVPDTSAEEQLQIQMILAESNQRPPMLGPDNPRAFRAPVIDMAKVLRDSNGPKILSDAIIDVTQRVSSVIKHMETRVRMTQDPTVTNVLSAEELESVNQLLLSDQAYLRDALEFVGSTAAALRAPIAARSTQSEILKADGVVVSGFDERTTFLTIIYEQMATLVEHIRARLAPPRA